MSEEDTMIKLLKELVKWTKVTSIPKVRELLLSILDSPEKMVAYQASDGERTSKEVGDQAHVSQPTISKWWKKWLIAGIAEPISVRGGERAKRSFSLNDFGVEVPAVATVGAKEGEGGEEET